MTDIFKIPQQEGQPDHWGYYSDSKADIIDCGIDQAKAEEMAIADSPKTTIATALANDSPPSVEPIRDDNLGNNSTSVFVDSSQTQSQVKNDAQPSNQNTSPEPTAIQERPKRPPLSPAFLKKIVEQLGRNTCNVSIELERFLFKAFGFTTEELAEDDPDVEIIKMGWDCLWQSYLAGQDPPIWMILAFGYSCTTVRLMTSAKRIKKQEPKDDENQRID